MKRSTRNFLYAFAAMELAGSLLIASRLSAQPAPTVEQVQEQANALITALQSQRNACQDQSAQTLANAQAQIAKLTKELEAAKSGPKTTDGTVNLTPPNVKPK